MRFQPTKCPLRQKKETICKVALCVAEMVWARCIPCVQTRFWHQPVHLKFCLFAFADLHNRQIGVLCVCPSVSNRFHRLRTGKRMVSQSHEISSDTSIYPLEKLSCIVQFCQIHVVLPIIQNRKISLFSIGNLLNGLFVSRRLVYIIEAEFNPTFTYYRDIIK